MGDKARPETNKYEAEILDYRIRFHDLRMDCYVRNCDSVYERFFSLDDLIKYSSNIKLKWA